MPSQTIQWFPGHMAKTRRLISENLSNVDIILEVLDARIPLSSRNPEIERLTAGKPRLVLLNKCSLADEKKTDAFRAYFSGKDTVCIAIDCITGQGMSRIAPAMREMLREKTLPSSQRIRHPIMLLQVAKTNLHQHFREYSTML